MGDGRKLNAAVLAVLTTATRIPALILLVFAMFLTTVEPVAAAPHRVAATADAPPARPIPHTDYPGWDGTTGLGEAIDPFFRGLVADIAQLSEEPEVREAAAAALAANTDQAILDFLDVGEPEAQARAKARRDATARQNRTAVERLAGTGGPIFNAEVTRVLAGSDYDRAAFLAYGKDIAADRDAKTTASAQARAADLRARVQILTGAGGPEVQRAAQAALTAGDAAIAAFLNGGYLEAAKRDADAREAYLKDLEEREKAAEQLSDLAKRAARANTARRNLLIANGLGIRALQRASNAMISANIAARQAAQILAANNASGQHSPSSFSIVVQEADRQLGYANTAATDAHTAALSAQTEVAILGETGLTYGSKWADLATGMANAAAGAASAALTARHAIDATMATDAARDEQQKAERSAEEARVWLIHAQEHARAAAAIAAAAQRQADASRDAAVRADAARVATEAAEQQAWAGAQRTHDARLTAEAEQRQAADSRRIAEAERTKADAARREADAQAAIARNARGEAEAQKQIAAAAEQRALDQEHIATDARSGALTEERNSATARDAAIAAERRKDAAEARAQAFEQAAAAARGTEHAAEADQAARQARTEAGTAATAATNARNAANIATGAAAQARQAATEAGQAAARARAAAEDAKAHAQQANLAASRAEVSAADTHVSASKAKSRAADATAAEVQAAVHARAAVALAERSAGEAVQSARGAARAGAEAAAAVNEAVSAATQAALAVRASLAARESAAAVVARTDTAITLTAPFAGTDIDADFVVQVADEARRVGEEQAAAAQTRANEANLAATLAQQAANRATGDAKAAYIASANAAWSARDAAQAAADAQRAAADAAADGAAARASASRAEQADAQARADALAARQAANTANNDAAIAGLNADAAETAATAARTAATTADADAAAARQAADAAERSAAEALQAADRARTAADEAAAAAQHARDDAVAAQTAADRAEQQQRRDDEVRRSSEASEVSECLSNIPEEDIATLIWEGEGLDLQDEYDRIQSQCANGGDVLAFLAEVGANVLLELLGVNDAIRCFGQGDIESCLWTVVNVASFLVILVKAVPVGKAIIAVVTNIGKYFAKSERLRNMKNKLKELLERLRHRVCPIPLAAAEHQAAADPPCMPGAKGTEHTSKTRFERGEIRLDSENPAPGVRPGRIHIQVKSIKDSNGHEIPFEWDFEKRHFDHLPDWVVKELRKEQQRFSNALNNALRALGEKEVRPRS